MTAAFPPTTLERLRTTQEVEILTGDPERPRRTIIWVMVDERDRVLVRSVRGPRGRWFRDLQRDPMAVLDVRGTTIRVRAELAADPDRVEACNRALRAKYRPGASLDSMLVPETLPTTLELVPDGSALPLEP